MQSFENIWARAARRKGGVTTLRASLPAVVSSQALVDKPDREYLSAMSRCVFQAGFAWHVVDAKWPGFEQAFYAFDPERLVALDDASWQAYLSDARIVRNGPKINAVRDNAAMVKAIAGEAHGFGRFLASWPADDLVGLLAHLQQRGSRLGGATGQRFLQMVGKDCFALSEEVVTCLQEAGVSIAAKPTSKRDLVTIQAVFNGWHEESGLPYRHLSEVMAASVREPLAVV